jgi:hypothetical protein
MAKRSSRWQPAKIRQAMDLLKYVLAGSGLIPERALEAGKNDYQTFCICCCSY